MRNQFQSDSLHREVGLAKIRSLVSLGILKAAISLARKSKNAHTRSLGKAAFNELFRLDQPVSDEKTKAEGAASD